MDEMKECCEAFEKWWENKYCFSVARHDVLEYEEAAFPIWQAWKAAWQFRAQPSELIDWDKISRELNEKIDTYIEGDEIESVVSQVINHLKSNGYLIKKPKE